MAQKEAKEAALWCAGVSVVIVFTSPYGLKEAGEINYFDATVLFGTWSRKSVEGKKNNSRNTLRPCGQKVLLFCGKGPMPGEAPQTAPVTHRVSASIFASLSCLYKQQCIQLRQTEQGKAQNKRRRGL